MAVEVHEGTMHDPAAVREFQAELRDLDVELAYDDFGAGRSRLMEIVKAPPDYLKFDACLIRDIDKAGTQHRRLVEMLVAIARESATLPLAEGIETLEELEACRELGFELAQGYYVGRPSDVANFVAFEEQDETLLKSGLLPPQAL
jgi:EAL domain-containing protein (putative c-di-GMP-specific phosphodiesterase class I)